MQQSVWQQSGKASHSAGKFGKLTENLRVDVVIVGGGVTGITAAYLIKNAGLTVALLERWRCLDGDSGRTTAHLTCVMDWPLGELVDEVGADLAQGAWQAGATAIDQIEEIVKKRKIACEFKRVPGYLTGSIARDQGIADYQDVARELEVIQREVDLNKALGFDAKFVKKAPVYGKPAMRIANQAKFHPVKYLGALLKEIDGNGSHVFEESEVTEFSESPLGVVANEKRVTCNYMVLATHSPIKGNADILSAALFQTRRVAYSTYVVGARIPHGAAPEALFWDLSDPYYYLRVDAGGEDGHDYAILGGMDHKTGQKEETEEQFKKLEEMMHRLFKGKGGAKVDKRWSGQVNETGDGLPLIGEVAEKQFIATGYAGNGMTFGTVAGMMALDAVLGQKNEWTEIFALNRVKLKGVMDYVKENIDYPFYMIKDRLMGTDKEGVESVKLGDGAIANVNGNQVAVYRDQRGNVTVLNPTCTHMGCVVHWNQTEKTWDCPCHGSRFKPTGEVLNGPAEVRLEKLTILGQPVGK